MKKTAILVGALAAACAFNAQAGAVVAAANSPASKMDADAVKRAFLGRDSSVTVIYQKGGPTRATFDQKVLGKSGADLSTYWSRLIFTGKAKAPVEVGSDADVKAKLAASPGAIGYISDAAVDGSVKVLHQF